MTKAEEVFTKVEQLVAGGKTKPQAFQELAEFYGQSYDTIRGFFYTRKKQLEGGSRPRRRETRPEDAFESVRTTLERSIVDIDREVEVARERADEATAEYEYLRDHADERKAEIQARLDAWRALDAEKNPEKKPESSGDPDTDGETSSEASTSETTAKASRTPAKKPAAKGGAES
ncbi:MAG TPA: hypothetical protein VN238_05925 [Solirubrobacteraceae bacterium]|nr:hypothetical protein [Solirubrobacteraceae bacterium]